MVSLEGEKLLPFVPASQGRCSKLIGELRLVVPNLYENILNCPKFFRTIDLNCPRRLE